MTKANLQNTPKMVNLNNNNYYYRFTALWILSGTTRVRRYQKGKTKTNLDFLQQEIVSGSGIKTHRNLNKKPS